jgi:hypothetical protein
MFCTFFAVFGRIIADSRVLIHRLGGKILENTVFLAHWLSRVALFRLPNGSGNISRAC